MDVVDHTILLEKLAAYKFSHSSLQWFKSYLNRRRQAVSNGNGLSEFITVNACVPQGSILGGISFLLFINDLPLFLDYCYSDFFADDATIHTNSKTLKKIFNPTPTMQSCGTNKIKCIYILTKQHIWS